MKVKIVGTPNKKSNGGNLFSHGAAWDTGLTYIGNGGTHEENPLGGVPSGIGANGNPNLVEEGEVIWKDQEYVFTNRKGPEDAQLKILGFGGSKNLTYADIALKVMDRLAERPNDPIEKDGANKTLEMLKNMQEDWRNKERAKELAKFIKNLSPEEQASMFSGMSQQPMGPEGYDNIPTDTMMNESQVPMGMEQGVPQQGQNEIAQVQGNDVMRPYAKGGPKANVFVKAGTKPSLDRQLQFNLGFYQDPLPEGYTDGMEVDLDKYGAAVTPVPNTLPINTYYNRHNKSGWYDKSKTSDFYNNLYEKDSPYSIARNFYMGMPANMQEAAYNQYWKDLYSKYNPGMKSPEFSTFLSAYPIGSSDKKYGPDHEGTINFGRDLLGLGDLKRERKRITPEREAPVPNNTDTVTNTDIASGFEKSPTWMRYAPVIGAGMGVISDMFGANDPDLSFKKRLESKMNAAATPHFISPTPIGNYLMFNPLDRNFYSNRANAQANANRRAVMDNTGISRNAALLAADRNANESLGDLYRKEAEFNNAERERVEGFNKDTNKYNSTNALEAEKYNANEMTRASQTALSNAMALENMISAANKESDTAKQLNLTNLMQGLGDIGRVNEQRNWLRNLAASGALGNKYNNARSLMSDKSAAKQYLMDNPDATEEDLQKAMYFTSADAHKYYKDMKDEIQKERQKIADENAKIAQRKADRAKKQADAKAKADVKEQQRIDRLPADKKRERDEFLSRKRDLVSRIESATNPADRLRWETQLRNLDREIKRKNY